MTIRNTVTSITGSSGTAPLVEGSTRGILMAGIFEILNLVAEKTDLLEIGEVGDYGAIVIMAVFVLGGIWDKFFKAR